MLSMFSISSSGFAPTVAPAAVRSAAVSPVMAVERSAAIPFLKKPPALDGSMVGDMGFDPLGISTTITELGGDLKYVREAELMHGRQAMLASVGMWFPAVFGKLWGFEGLSDNPLVAQYELSDIAVAQIFLSIGIAEGLRARIIFGEDRPAGDHGLDPA